MKPLKRISTAWTPALAYCVGLIASDGCLSKNGRHITLVSKDLEQIITFKELLGIKANIKPHGRGGTDKKDYYHLQFGDVNFYKFLLSIGLTPAKSKTISELTIPKQFIMDFLRGSFDGDGTFYSYWDKRWKSSYLFYLAFISASLAHLDWIRVVLHESLSVKGHISNSKQGRSFQLRYAKSETRKIINSMYYSANIPKLERKYRKVYNALVIDELNKSARVL